MNWPLQENFLDKKSKKDLVNFIAKNTRFTQFNKVRESLRKNSQNGMEVNIQFLLILEVQQIYL